MQKLAAVEEAKSLFNEAKGWGVWRWLMEKRRARTTADAAWAALDEYEQKVKDGWRDDLKKAYRGTARNADPKIKETVKRLKEAEEEADRVHQEAEDIFAEADRRLSTTMACEGAQRAIEAWEMREKVIRKLEAAGRI